MSWKQGSRAGLVLVLGSVMACAAYVAYRWVTPITAEDKNAFLGWLVPAVIEGITLILAYRVSHVSQKQVFGKGAHDNSAYQAGVGASQSQRFGKDSYNNQATQISGDEQ